MRYAAYPTYKQSDVEWLGDVPEHWDIRRITQVFQVIGSGTTPDTDEADYYDGDTPWITTSELREGVVLETRSSVSSLALAEYSALSVYPAGSVVIAMYGATIGRLGVLGVPSAVNQACCVFASPTLAEPRFVFYWLWMRRSVLVSLAVGGGQPNLSQIDLRRIRIPMPVLDEQVGIADFLDAQTAKIDALVAKKRELIEKLKEKRAALISRSVTCGLPPEAARTAGLDPHPRLKPSGVEWLGDVPEHWEVSPLRYVGQAVIGLTYDPADVVDEADGVLVLRASNVSNGQIVFTDNVYVATELPERLRTRVGDILICSRSGSRALIGKNARIEGDAAGLTFGTFMTIFRSAWNDYLFHVFNSTLFESQSAAFLTSTINQLTVSNLYSFEVPLPPRGEQIAITEFLTHETERIDRLIAAVEKAVERLQEYRAALITAAVTGKIDFRDADASTDTAISEAAA